MTLYNNTLFNGGMFNGEPVVGLSSSDDIVFSNYGLQNSNIVTSFFKDDNPPDKIYDTQNFPRGSGRIFVDSHQEVKTIQAGGSIKANDSASFVELIKEFKKYLRVDNGMLKKTEGGVTRQYIANLIKLDIPREAWNINYAKWSAEFQVFSPFGFSENREATTQAITSASFSNELYHDGNVDDGRLIASFVVDSETDMTALSLTNSTRSETITVTTAFNSGDILTINGEDQTVKKNGTSIDFTGVIPSLDAGANTITGTVTSTAHSIIATYQFYNYFS